LLVLVALWIVGARTSLVRASLLFAFLAAGSVLADCGLILRRSVRPMNGLSAAAVAMLALRPGAIYDAGFQLTFCATAAILVFFSGPADWSGRIARYAERFGRFAAPIRWALTLVAVTVAAQAGAMPVVAHQFGTLHPLSIAANPLVVPLAGVSLWCGFGASLLSGTVLLPYAVAPFSVALSGLKAIVIGLSGIPFSQLEVGPWMGIWGGALVAFVVAVSTYFRGSSSWTWNSTSMTPGRLGRPRAGRLRRRRNRTASSSPAASVSRPGTSSRRPARNRNPSD
jgi:ComEC/Rec2-related protein